MTEDIIDHTLKCNECREFLKEQFTTDAYRALLKKDLRDVLRDELNTGDEIKNKVNDLDIQSIPVKILGKRIYVAQLAGITAFVIIAIKFVIYIIAS